MRKVTGIIMKRKTQYLLLSFKEKTLPFLDRNFFLEYLVRFLQEKAYVVTQERTQYEMKNPSGVGQIKKRSTANKREQPVACRIFFWSKSRFLYRSFSEKVTWVSLCFLNFLGESIENLLSIGYLKSLFSLSFLSFQFEGF